MKDRAKQRLMGILVLLGALFVILPFLFHNSRPSLNTAIAKTSNNAENSSISVTLPPDHTTLANNSTSTGNTFTPDQSVSATSGLTTGAPSGQPASTAPVTLPVSQTLTTTQTESLHQTAAITPMATTAKLTTAPKPLPVSAAVVPAPAIIKPLIHAAHKQRVVQGGWSVQLAAFSDRKNADILLAKLRAQHFQAYTRTLSGHKKLILVFAGPERTAYEARWIQGRLKQGFHLTGIVKKIDRN